MCTGSGLGGSDVRPSSSSPQLLALLLRLDGELRSRGPGTEGDSVWEVGKYRVGKTLRSHTRPVVRQVAEVLSPDVSSARGYLSSEVSETKEIMGQTYSQHTQEVMNRLNF